MAQCQTLNKNEIDWMHVHTVYLEWEDCLVALAIQSV